MAHTIYPMFIWYSGRPIKVMVKRSGCF